ncbi:MULTISPECIES: VTT domain-containing protein [Dehalococcoides]|jgi:membrane protein YqaA with SNARE-associated domain|uniref:Putative membrane protein n=1 Tax=Dehalococcoides mccartyi TaxID=61435 RepID=A0A142VB59_9CHLR|nr:MULTISPECIES: VTT domain-containing protein [Dehalococcoides]AII61368.1 hypothetical protein X794_06060 [Dehalococcoides mccartyi CG5]AMU87070.1 putative membrane protein [Dehalococcoides mccartyi]AOV99856.1 membrane protein [Dehalococcoides mccartyi]MBA2085638.1 putative membrane protein [Dehalococcoides mccartyi]OBW61393.1 MAG: hypothetical protein A9183_04605 [Dehalococcoides mccartyi]
MAELPEEEISICATGAELKTRTWFKKWGIWLGVLVIIISIALSVWLIIRRDIIQDLAGYGYIGMFAISFLGSSISIVPVPMLAVQFTLGGVLPPPVGDPILGPLFAGVVASLAEALGGFSIYMTGYSGKSSLAGSDSGSKLNRLYCRMLKLMERRGSLMVFILSAIINPFFYPMTLAAGAVNFGIRKFMLISLAGKFIKCTAICYAGYFGLTRLFGLE